MKICFSSIRFYFSCLLISTLIGCVSTTNIDGEISFLDSNNLKNIKIDKESIISLEKNKNNNYYFKTSNENLNDDNLPLDLINYSLNNKKIGIGGIENNFMTSFQ